VADAAALADEAASILSGMRLAAEIYLEETAATVIAVSAGKVERVEVKEERGVGIRVFDGGRAGFAYTSDLAPGGIRRAAETAAALASLTDPDPGIRLPRPSAPPQAGPDEEPSGIESTETYRKIALARAMEDAARGVDPRISKVREARYEDLLGRVEVRTTEGFRRGGAFARIYGSADVVAEQEGSIQSGAFGDFALRFSALDPFKIGREAAHRAIDKLGAVRPATCTADVVFDPFATAELLRAFSPAFSAEEAQKGRSFLAGRAGSRIAPEAVTIVDDGRLPGADRTFPFDGEGFSTGRTVVVEKGILRGFLHNSRTASRSGTSSTGNAVRSSYMSLPRVGATTLHLVPSERTPEEILAAVTDGFRISELMGLHTVDPVAGGFSLGASGRRIVSGRLGEPVQGLALAGSIAGFLGGLAAVGADLRLLPGDAAGSTALVKGLSVGGSDLGT
jgi:PmbA protein